MQKTPKSLTGEKRSRMKRWRLLLFLMALLGFLGSGCIIFPVPLAYLQIGEELHQEQFQVGSSTKEEVLEGTTPDLILTDQNKFFYFWQESDSGLSIQTYQGGGTQRTWIQYLGMIRFDEKDIVESLWAGKQPARQYSLEALVYGQPVADKINARDKEHRRSFLLMRVVVDIDGHWLEYPLDHFTINGMGFRTMHKFKKIKEKRIKSRFSDAGWVVLEAVPGELRYISFSRKYGVGRRSGKSDDLGRPIKIELKKIKLPVNLTHWKISVPEGPITYAGTFVFRNRKKGSLEVHCDEIRDENDLALDVIRKQFSEDIVMSVSFAEKHTKPFVLRIPPTYR